MLRKGYDCYKYEDVKVSTRKGGMFDTLNSEIYRPQGAHKWQNLPKR